MRIVACIIFAVTWLICSGCRTAIEHVFPSWPHLVYSGTRSDCCSMVRANTNEPVRVTVLSYFDLPFSFVGDTLLLPYDVFQPHVGPYKPGEFFPNRTNAIMTTVGDLKDSQFCPDKSITDDYQKYIQFNKIKSITEISFYLDGKIHYEGYRQVLKDGTGWHAIVITEMRPNDKYIEHILEYDKSDTRTKVRRVSWKSWSW